jgi:hypothetical protein
MATASATTVPLCAHQGPAVRNINIRTGFNSRHARSPRYIGSRSTLGHLVHASLPCSENHRQLARMPHMGRPASGMGSTWATIVLATPHSDFDPFQCPQPDSIHGAANLNRLIGCSALRTLRVKSAVTGIGGNSPCSLPFTPTTPMSTEPGRHSALGHVFAVRPRPAGPSSPTATLTTNRHSRSPAGRLHRRRRRSSWSRPVSPTMSWTPAGSRPRGRTRWAARPTRQSART